MSDAPKLALVPSETGFQVVMSHSFDTREKAEDYFHMLLQVTSLGGAHVELWVLDQDWFRAERINEQLIPLPTKPLGSQPG